MTTFDSLDAAFGRRRIRATISVERDGEDFDIDVAGNYIPGVESTHDSPGYAAEVDDVVAVEYVEGKGYVLAELSTHEWRKVDEAIENKAIYSAAYDDEECPRRRRHARCW
jgi:hypothetical protein